jgi:hypothetical protein
VLGRKIRKALNARVVVIVACEGHGGVTLKIVRFEEGLSGWNFAQWKSLGCIKPIDEILYRILQCQCEDKTVLAGATV